MPAARRSAVHSKGIEAMNEHPDDLRHVSSCRACRERYVADNVVAFPADRESRRRDLMSTAKKLKQEKDHSAGVVARHLRSTPVDEWSRLAEEPELRNSAALEQLSEEVRRLLDREPREALALSNVATAIAETLSGNDYPDTILGQMRATAWKDRANALRYLSRYPEAIEAINRAEERLAPHPALAYDRAVVRLVKAMIAHQVGDTETAYSLLRNCRAMFESFGDRERANMAGMVEANFLYDERRYYEAATIFSALLEESNGNIEKEAGLHSNLGYCHTHIGDFTAANIHFSEATAKFSEIGQRAAALRTQRGAGLVLLSKGDVVNGLKYLDAARQRYLELHMIEEAGLCGLDMIESLAERGQGRDAANLVDVIISEFKTAEMSQLAIDALSRLAAVIANGDTETAMAVRNVSTFIRQIGEQSHGAGVS
jgi:tetratricopeptide (TPR) repeat protein